MNGDKQEDFPTKIQLLLTPLKSSIIASDSKTSIETDVKIEPYIEDDDNWLIDNDKVPILPSNDTHEQLSTHVTIVSEIVTSQSKSIATLHDKVLHLLDQLKSLSINEKDQFHNIYWQLSDTSRWLAIQHNHFDELRKEFKKWRLDLKEQKD